MKRLITALLIVTLLVSGMTVAMASGTKLFVTTGKCQMRSEPNLNGDILVTLPKNTRFRTVDFDTDERGVTWQFGEYKGHFGWVSERNLKEIKDDFASDPVKPKKKKKSTAKKETPQPTKKPTDFNSFKEAGYEVEVTSETLNLRKGPSTDYKIVKTYECGDVLYKVRGDGKWAEVMDTENMIAGYMSEKYLKTYKPEEKAPKGTCIEPMEASFDPDDLGDGPLQAGFEPENVKQNADGEIEIEDISFFTEDVYDIAEIAQMKPGDIIVVHGEEITVKEIEDEDGLKKVNGGYENGGATLATRDDSNGWFLFEADDMGGYTEQCIVTLKLKADAVFTDEADLEKGEVKTQGAEEIMKAIQTSEISAFTPYSTQIVLENGEIAEIHRVYVP